MDIRRFLDSASKEELESFFSEMVATDNPEAISTLAEVLLYRISDTFLKHDIPKIAALAMVHKGKTGVQKLAGLLVQAPGYIYPESILAVLWYASKGMTPFDFGYITKPPSLSNPIPNDAVEEARHAVYDVILESRVNPELFNVLIGFLHGYNIIGYMRPEHQAFSITDVFEAFTAGTIKISRQLLEQFERLVESAQPEEAYQSFLKAHPVFLDPLASDVTPKQKLGLEFITDFVVRPYDGRYVLVEIEKPQDLIFTAANDFSANFTHAYGQVIDFLQWIDAHGDYARSLMVGISAPRGLLVIGRSNRLTLENREKLRRFIANSIMVDVLTFDDVAIAARNLYTNLYRL